jgi:hypothetical protein
MALTSLKVRGFIEGKTRYYVEVKLTEAGRREAEQFTERGVEP